MSLYSLLPGRLYMREIYVRRRLQARSLPRKFSGAPVGVFSPPQVPLLSPQVRVGRRFRGAGTQVTGETLTERHTHSDKHTHNIQKDKHTQKIPKDKHTQYNHKQAQPQKQVRVRRHFCKKGTKRSKIRLSYSHLSHNWDQGRLFDIREDLK